MTTVGEPIEPAVWRWYYDLVGKGGAVIAAGPSRDEAGRCRTRRAWHSSDHL
jgi:hypothetical protein